MSMFCACGRCPPAYSAGVRTSSTIVPGAFMAVAKSLAAMCWPVAGEVELLVGALDEQAVTPVTAATANAAAATRRVHDRVGCIRMLLTPCGEGRVSEVGVDCLEREPSAGEVAGVEPHTSQYAGGQVGADAAGAVHTDLATAGQCGDLVEARP